MCKAVKIKLGILFVRLSLVYGARGKDAAIPPVNLIIDTDAGGDDAVAILLALSEPRVRVLAITCTYGNTDLSNVETNVLKILTVANRTDIPVYSGAKKPLNKTYTPPDHFGEDGFGDFDFGRPIEGRVNRSMHASSAMIELAKKYKGDVTILTLGPLTNVALAMLTDPTFSENVKRFYLMGARFSDKDCKDSLTKFALDRDTGKEILRESNEATPPTYITDEKRIKVNFNFALDPASNEIFFRTPKKALPLVIPSEINKVALIPKEWREKVLGSLPSVAMAFLNQAERLGLKTSSIWKPSDSLACSATLWPEMVRDKIEVRLEPVVYGPYEGAATIDCHGTPNAEVVRNFDIAGFKEKLLTLLA